MKILKFTINEDYYNEFKDRCLEENITVKKKLNVLVSRDSEYIDINQFSPSDFDKNIKKVTLKVNEELYKGVMKKCGKEDVRASKYLPYLIYKFLTVDEYI